MVALQKEASPDATQDEIKLTKVLLSEYRSDKLAVTEFERRTGDGLSSSQWDHYQELQERLCAIESAVRMIPDPEVHQIIEMRYIKGERNKYVVHRFSSMHPTTVNRKLKEGVASVAKSLKLLLQ